VAIGELPHLMPEGSDIAGDPYFANRAQESRRRHEAYVAQKEKELSMIPWPDEKDARPWYEKHEKIAEAVVVTIAVAAALFVYFL